VIWRLPKRTGGARSGAARKRGFELADQALVTDSEVDAEFNWEGIARAQNSAENQGFTMLCPYMSAPTAAAFIPARPDFGAVSSGPPAQEAAVDRHAL